MKVMLQNYFIPGNHNDYTPDIFQRSALLGMLLLVVMSFTAANLHALLWQSSQWLVGAVLPAVVVSLTNEERADVVMPPLVRNAVLDEAARLKAEHMAKNSYFSHYSPDGVSPWHWFAEVEYQFAHAGENLAVHFTDSDMVVDAWMNSPTHRANIVNGNYREIGVGTAKGRYEGHSTIFVVQLFGTPAATSTRVVAALPEIAVVPESVPATNPIPLPQATVAGVDSVTFEDVSVAPLPDMPVVISEVEPAEVRIPAEEHIATSTGLAAAEVTSIYTADAEMPLIASAAVRPSFVLQLVYSLIGLLVACALAISVCVEWRRQRPVQLAYGIALLLCMSGLFYLHLVVSSGVTIV